MCELFGMSARHPTDVNHSLALLRPRGGEIGPHADGWGPDQVSSMTHTSWSAGAAPSPTSWTAS